MVRAHDRTLTGKTLDDGQNRGIENGFWPSLRNVLVVTKVRVHEAESLGLTIARWMRPRCQDVNVVSSEQDSPFYADPELDLVIVLGGDGTILGVARHIILRKIPIVCINFGRVGFLADIEPENWEQGLAAALSSNTYRSAASLRWALLRYGHLVAGGYAVNDVVLSRSSMARLVYANIYTDGELMGSVRADGFLLSSAIGSSGYSVSANGPLLFPTLNALAFVPICPFLNTIPPMVFPTNTVFRFHLLPGTTESYLTVDGQEGHMMQTNDIVEIEGIPDCVRFLGKGLSFIERLRTRSFILQNPMSCRDRRESQPIAQPVESPGQGRD